MLKKYFQKKSKLGIVIDVAIFLLLLLLIIPSTRKNTAALLLKPTLIIHQPREEKQKLTLQDDVYQWQLSDVNGRMITLSDFKEKPLFINFWATWCPPCIAEMDGLQKLYDEYGTRVAFLFITNDETAKVKEFLKEKGYSIPVYFPQSKYPKDFEISSLPTTFLISSKSEIVINKKGVAQWNGTRIKNILDKVLHKGN